MGGKSFEEVLLVFKERLCRSKDSLLHKIHDCLIRLRQQLNEQIGRCLELRIGTRVCQKIKGYSINDLEDELKLALILHQVIAGRCLRDAQLE